MDILAKNLLILASAGSGKTFQLGNRVIGLVARGAAPERIVALTFTRKAAGEFADSVLTKLANAAHDDAAASRLRATLALPDADFGDALQRVVRALPSLTLGTMDGFFARIVRGFQYELGLHGGKFDLLEGPRAAMLADEMLAGVLGDTLAREEGEEFFHAFRRATHGKEDQGVLAALRGFVTRWQSIYQESRSVEWGPPALADVNVDEWTKQKSALAAAALAGLDAIDYTDKRQRAQLEKEITNLENHVIGGGSLGKASSLMSSILDAVATPTGPLFVKFQKEFVIGGVSGEALRDMVKLAARCEFAAALQRTRAVRDVVAVFDDLCARRLRSKGLLGFNDVKLLMGEWARGEDARLRREAVDFRLDARFDHWLLDEFQDTSRADWMGLQPLIDEAASDDDGSMFIVGDRKQAIYAWRGGDVRLFDEVQARYGSGLSTETMAESWRSCPEVLALVNQVCGDSAEMHALFGNVAERWQWDDHFTAEPLQQPSNRGQARVELVGDWDERLDRAVEILNELGVGRRAMTCGILLRGNEQVREVTDHLRMHGFDVIEEGRRVPAKDNPVGIVIAHLLKWLADPADLFARGVLEMSPLAAILKSSHGDAWPLIWENMTTLISREGFAAPLERILTSCRDGLSDFGRRRAGDLLAALGSLDAQGGITPREAADWLERLEISQSPGIAAVQVMTIHKAKGLGFDVVLLPEVPDEGIPQMRFFEIAEGDGWLTQTPPKWVRAIVPELRIAEEQWAAAQRYESFCMLYVALTRAKRGLYVLLEPPAKTSDPDKPSLANWLARSAGSSSETGLSDWPDLIPMNAAATRPAASPLPGPCIQQRGRMIPSATKSNARISTGGTKFGTEVHALLERIAWVDEAPPQLPRNDAGMAVAQLIRNPNLRHVFERQGRRIEIFTEQATDAVIGNELLTGTIDRLHLHRDDAGIVTTIEIIDYKTDAVTKPDDLIERYSGQMNAYRKALAAMHPGVEITCSLISVRHGALVSVLEKQSSVTGNAGP
jgi:ATP-dependent helicase/nuclease subunit A